jgi:hypothetical protein
MSRPARAALAVLPCLLLVLALLALPSAAPAARPLQTAVDPDGPYSGQDATTVANRLRSAGASGMRVLLNWREVAPANPSAGFDPTNPGDPEYKWQKFEGEVRAAAAAGLQPIVVIRSAPDWAEGPGAGREGTVQPDPGRFAQFAHAVATRYSGGFQGLPRIRYWQAWNEPNHFGFLNPQANLAAVGHYRALLNAFADAVHAVRADNAVIAGGMAPFRNDASDALVIPPLAFMRALLCVSSDRKPKATCNTSVKFDIWSHHPYTSGSPTHDAANADDASISALPQMRRMLSAAARAGHVVSNSPLRFWVTEFAWDSNPPDPNGVPERLRSRWIAEALYRMWRARVSLVTWYKLRDDETGGRPHSATFESGLYYRCSSLACDRPKPSLQAFRFPFVAFRSGRRVYVWGRTPTSKRARVTVQQRVGRRWKRLARLRANRYGIFSRRVRTSRRGKLRAVVSKTGDASISFSLRRPPDRPVNPFG